MARSPSPSPHRRSHHKSSKKSKKSSKKSKKSSKSRRRSRSSSSRSSSASSTELLTRLQRDREQMKAQRRSDKVRMKEEETLEEKRRRRILKKQMKALKQREKEGWTESGYAEYDKYSNEDNPFGDPQLKELFRWNKKLSKEGLDQLDDRELARLQHKQQLEQRVELEKVKERRRQRELEFEERQKLIEYEERQRENEKFSKWRDQEDEFHLSQARQRSKIRIKDGRAKPIDLLAKYIEDEDDDEDYDAIEMHEPHTYLDGLGINDLEDLLEDIRVYRDIDLDKNKDYWDDLVVIVNDQLSQLRKQRLQQQSSSSSSMGRRDDIHDSVVVDVTSVFADKTSEQLAVLQKNIEDKLKGRGEGIDINYWEALLTQLKAHLAKARLKDRHKENLKRKLQHLKANQSKETEPISKTPAKDETEWEKTEREEDEENNKPYSRPSTSKDTEKNEERKTATTTTMKNSDTKDDDNHAHYDYSPRYLRPEELEPGTIIVKDEEDEARRQQDRLRSLKGVKVQSVLNAEEKALEQEARKGMGDGESSFAVESSLLDQTYEWSDKYRPRKPRYFNRVHTGFEWNKYNQTHYDMDNPPPKIVQGYKFNIFYPDLIDKKVTPKYTLTACEDNSDFCILRITAGPPYEDIAFKIVNREWEYGYKRGFKCQFHNNIFQLWFHFKRLRYRR